MMIINASDVRKMGGYEELIKKNSEKQTKYRNKKPVWVGVWRGRAQKIKFDSLSEMMEFQFIKIDPDVRELRLQEPFVLQEGTKSEKPIIYVADFFYYSISKRSWVVREKKGMWTQVAITKRKLFKAKFPDIIFEEIRA